MLMDVIVDFRCVPRVPNGTRTSTGNTFHFCPYFDKNDISLLRLVIIHTDQSCEISATTIEHFGIRV